MKSNGAVKRSHYHTILLSVAIAAFLWGMASCVTTGKQKNYGIDNDHPVPEGLSAGQKAPNFTAIATDGEKISLDEMTSRQPVMLFFYRGYWCPVCNRYLKNYQDSLQLITGKEVTVIGIAPETAENIRKTKDKAGVEFTLISDSTESIMEKYDVKFKVTKGYQKMVTASLFTDIAKNNGQDDAYLPVPATYLINSEGIIVWKQFDKNYKNRAHVADILKAIDTHL